MRRGRYKCSHHIDTKPPVRLPSLRMLCIISGMLPFTEMKIYYNINSTVATVVAFCLFQCVVIVMNKRYCYCYCIIIITGVASSDDDVDVAEA